MKEAQSNRKKDLIMLEGFKNSMKKAGYDDRSKNNGEKRSLKQSKGKKNQQTSKNKKKNEEDQQPPTIISQFNGNAQEKKSDEVTKRNSILKENQEAPQDELVQKTKEETKGFLYLTNETTPEDGAVYYPKGNLL